MSCCRAFFQQVGVFIRISMASLSISSCALSNTGRREQIETIIFHRKKWRGQQSPIDHRQHAIRICAHLLALDWIRQIRLATATEYLLIHKSYPQITQIKKKAATKRRKSTKSLFTALLFCAFCAFFVASLCNLRNADYLPSIAVSMSGTCDRTTRVLYFSMYSSASRRQDNAPAAIWITRHRMERHRRQLIRAG
jgi:hypothetical protein